MLKINLNKSSFQIIFFNLLNFTFFDENLSEWLFNNVFILINIYNIVKKDKIESEKQNDKRKRMGYNLHKQPKRSR